MIYVLPWFSVGIGNQDSKYKQLIIIHNKQKQNTKKIKLN